MKARSSEPNRPIPSIGERGRRETVRELRLEFICPSRKAGRRAGGDSSQSFVRRACDRRVSLARARIADRPSLPASAASAGWPSRDRCAELARTLRRALGITVRRRGGRPRSAGRCALAVACGAGDDFLKDAARAGADALLTGEARFHRGVEAETLGIGLLVAGHYATERPGVEHLAEQIGRAFPGLLVWPSRLERDAFRTVGPSET